MIKIDPKLNLVIPIYRGDTPVMYVHSQPISREIFETYFMVIARAFSSIYAGGLGMTSGPRVAALLLRKTAQDLGLWDGPGGVETGLLPEMRRLTNVIQPALRGWEVIPFQEALDRKTIDPDDVSEVENALAFFMVASAMHKRAELGAILDGVAKMWGAQTSLLNCTEFCSSLETSTGTDNSGEKPLVAGLSVPS